MANLVIQLRQTNGLKTKTRGMTIKDVDLDETFTRLKFLFSCIDKAKISGEEEVTIKHKVTPEVWKNESIN